MNKVCAVVVTFNRKKLLSKCINSIKTQTYPCDVLVINNNSSDNTTEYLIENKINHVNLKKNLGGAGGFNVGIKTAIEKGYEYVWVMDDDCIPKDDSLEKLINAKKLINDDFGFLSSKVIWKDGNLHNMNKSKYREKDKLFPNLKNE